VPTRWQQAAAGEHQASARGDAAKCKPERAGGGEKAWAVPASSPHRGGFAGMEPAEPEEELVGGLGESTPEAAAAPVIVSKPSILWRGGCRPEGAAAARGSTATAQRARVSFPEQLEIGPTGAYK
jgi:hypothetical protein